MSKVVVQLLSWNGEKYLPALLRSLAQQSFSNWKLLVLDNGSKDTSVTIVQEWIAVHGGTLVQKKDNIGFAAGHNELFRSSDAPYVLVLNQDVVLDAKYIERLVTVLEKHRSAASVTGLLVDTLSHEKSVIDSAGLAIFRTHRVVERLRGVSTNQAPQTVHKVFGVPATVALYRRAALQLVAIERKKPDYFDSKFFSYKEDVDLSYRLQLAGWDSYCEPSALASHDRSVRGDKTNSGFGNRKTIANRKSKNYFGTTLSYRNHLYFLFSCFAFSPFSKTFLYTFLYELGKVLVLACTEIRSLRFGLVQLMKSWHEVRAKRKQIFDRSADLDRINQWFC